MNGAERELARQIESQIAEAVTLFGVAGKVRVEAGAAALEGAGRVPIGALLEQWDMLPMDIRRRRCNELARQLVELRRAGSSSAGRKPRFAGLGLVTPLVILAGGAALVFLAYRALAPAGGRGPKGAAPAAAAGSSADDDTERSQRAARICGETRARVMRGASIGPTDVEGWVVELSFLRGGDTPPLELDPALGEFVTRPPGQASGSFNWAGAPELSVIHGPMTHVTVADASLPRTGKPRFRGVTLTFSGRYVAPYFTAGRRGTYRKVADAIASRLGASYGALYAHCAGGGTHHIGAWFRGPEPGGAAASLVYFMGTYAPGSHVRRSVLMKGGAVDRAAGLERIARATGKLDKRHVATLLGDSGGSIAGRPHGPATLTFPFKEANRSERASAAIADAVQLSH